MDELSASKAVLGLVIQRPDTAASIRIRMEQRFPDAHWSSTATENNLKTLLRQGYIRVVEQGRKPRMSRYEATEEGIAHFRRWIRSAAAPPLVMRDTLQGDDASKNGDIRVRRYRSCRVPPARASAYGRTLRLRYAIAAFAGIAVILFGSASSALAAEETGQITGRVTNAATQAGIEGLEVCARSRSERTGGHCARTGPNGAYTISEVPAGSYVVEFVVPFWGDPASQSNLDYAPQYYDGKSTQAQAEEVTVAAGQTTSGIDAAMESGGEISGVVTDAVTGDPIAGVMACPGR